MFSRVQPTAAPVVLVPGLGGSILINRERPDRFFFKKRVVNNRWISPDMFSPSQYDAWSQEIGIDLRRCPTSQRVLGYSGSPDIEPFNFGGIHGVQNVAPELWLNHDTPDAIPLFDNLFNHRYFGPLISSLHNRNALVAAAPYDFRTILDPEVRASYWRDLRVLIEKMTYKVEKPTVVVAHSQGALLTKWFLEEMDPQWVRMHVHAAILVNCPFGGTPQAVRTVLQGASYLPFRIRMLEKIYHRHVEINAGVIMGLPNANVYDPSEIFWTEGEFQISLEDFARSSGRELSVGFQVWRDLFQEHTGKLIRPAPVPIHLYMSANVPTERMYKNGEAVLTTGDGIVPDQSLFAYNKHAADIVRVHGVNHSLLLQSQGLADYVYSVSLS